MKIDWTDMVRYQQQVQKITRLLIPSKQNYLTTSECEILAWLYLNQEQNTPILLSQNTGMRKEAVSRCLKSLADKKCISKIKQTDDERSYKIILTENGISELQKGYQAILQPFYDLWRSAGTDFEDFLKSVDKITSHLEKRSKK